MKNLLLTIFGITVLLWLTGCGGVPPESVTGVPSGIYADPGDQGAGKPGAVCLIDMTRSEDVRAAAAKADGGEPAYLKRMRSRLAEASGINCEAVHFSMVTPEMARNPHWRVIVIMGFSWQIPDNNSQMLQELIRRSNVPIIGFCGGHQLIVKAFGGKVGKMRQLRPGEADPNPRYHPGWFKEWGFLPVRILHQDPLFDGLGPVITVMERHAWQASDVPPELLLLASSGECPVEAVKHRDRPIYGVQFHPEGYDKAHSDGKTILRNFFRPALRSTL